MYRCNCQKSAPSIEILAMTYSWDLFPPMHCAKCLPLGTLKWFLLLSHWPCHLFLQPDTLPLALLFCSLPMTCLKVLGRVTSMWRLNGKPICHWSDSRIPRRFRCRAEELPFPGEAAQIPSRPRHSACFPLPNVKLAWIESDLTFIADSHSSDTAWWKGMSGALMDLVNLPNKPKP